MKQVSRRNFLKGTAGAALGAAAVTALGAMPSQTTANAAEELEECYAPFDKIPAAYLNPQKADEEYRSNDMELTALFSPLKIGNVEIGNRMVKSAAGSACYLSGLGDELLQYYVNMAKGGVELIIVETITAMEIPAGGQYSEETKSFRPCHLCYTTR